MILSVVIPFHEDSPLLHRSIRSVVNQLSQHTELILVGDGVDSLTSKKTQRLYPKSTVYLISKSGANSARMEGLKHSTGQYILFVDSDDVIPPTTLDYYIGVINNHNPDLIIGNVWRMRASGKPRPFYHFSSAQQVLKKDALTLSQLYYFPVLICKCFKKELLINCPVQDYLFYQDIAITAFLFKNTHNIYYNNIVLYHYYQRIGSTSHYSANTEGNIIATLPLMDDICNYYNQHKLSNTEKEYLKLLTIRFYHTIIQRSFQLNSFSFSNLLRKKFIDAWEKNDCTISLLYPKAFLLKSILSNAMLFRIYFQLIKLKPRI